MPFHSEFEQGEAIMRFLTEHGPYPTLDVRVNGSDKPLARPYRNTMSITTLRMLISRISKRSRYRHMMMARQSPP